MTLKPKTALATVPRSPRSTALLVLTGLLLPGGVLVFVWMLCRRVFSSGVSLRGLKRVAQLLVVILLQQGCATQYATPTGVPAEGPAVARTLRFQNPSAEPAHENAFIGRAALRPGDILLTSMPGFAAAGIELFTVAPVSHSAVYIGDGRVVEAVREGVRERTIEKVIAEESIALVLRDPDLSDAQAQRIRAYALQKIGAGFNFFGVTVQIPYAIGRRACELPLVAAAPRDACIRALGLLSLPAPTERQLFCSQLVLQAYRYAGVPLTDADPRIMSPADILHMREGDVPAVRIRRTLRYVGHLKYDRMRLAGVEG